MWWKSFLVACVAFASGSLVALYAAGPPLGSGQVQPLTVTSRALPLNAADPSVERVGRLRYLGGLHLESPDRRVGGISGLLWDAPCKRLLAVTDSGAWLILEPREDGDRLIGIGESWIGPVLAPDGRPYASKRAADAESLVRMPGGDIWLFFEQEHRGTRFRGLSACRPESLAAAPSESWKVPNSTTWPENGGIEAAAAAGDDLRLLTESVPGKSGTVLGLAGRTNGTMEPFSYRIPAGHSPTAMESRDLDGANGHMIVLHRRFSPLSGASAVIAEVEFAGEDLAAAGEGAVEPRIIGRLAPPLLVDNMEALAVRQEGERRFLYLMSDNNFNPMQRTLLMKFELLPKGAKP